MDQTYNSDVILALNSSHTVFGYKYTDKEDQLIFQFDIYEILRATRVSTLMFIGATGTSLAQHIHGR